MRGLLRCARLRYGTPFALSSCVHPNNFGSGDSEVGSMLESLLFEAGGEASNEPRMTVLSCGGIFVPKRRKISIELKNWQQIVNIPGRELSAKIFGYETVPEEPISPRGIPNELEHVLRKEVLN